MDNTDPVQGPEAEVSEWTYDQVLAAIDAHQSVMRVYADVSAAEAALSRLLDRFPEEG
jgi:hypothetical protein